MRNAIVYIFDEDCYGRLIQRNAHWSIVSYDKGGIEYEVQILNDDYEIRAEDDELDSDDDD